ncbi:hypothetical protein [Mucilaginibacter sp. dw_454]|uniref:hypothetical protein n=1 Tax=Mucilaginibacter sp. dw_454 TaxID=2720079 RepID=UPI001BD2C051|nr:hypothetical protein [Mucilaginibacter sp. dw_454]
MKPICTIILLLLLTSCVKTGIAPASSKPSTPTITADSLSVNTITPHADTINTYDWYNGTKGTALIQVTCTDCNAIATIGNTTAPFLFNAQGVGRLKYTPSPGLSIYIAVCPSNAKAFKAEIFDAANAALYSYTGVGGNWSDTFVIQ